MGNREEDVLRVEAADADIEATIRERQQGFTTDTHKRAYMAVGGTTYYWPSEGSDITGGNLYTEEYVYHVGDTDTNLRFQTDQATLNVGGLNFLDAVEAGTDYLEINAGEVDIDTIINGTSANLLVCDAGNNRVGIGINSPNFQLSIADSSETTTASIETYSPTNTHISALRLVKSKSSTIGTGIETVNNDYIGMIEARGYNSNNSIAVSAQIRFEQDGAAGATFIPGRILFETATNAAGIVEVMRIDSSRNVGINQSAPDNARLEVLDASNPQLRLTHTDDTDYIQWEIDSDGNSTRIISGTKEWITHDKYYTFGNTLANPDAIIGMDTGSSPDRFLIEHDPFDGLQSDLHIRCVTGALILEAGGGSTNFAHKLQNATASTDINLEFITTTGTGLQIWKDVEQEYRIGVSPATTNYLAIESDGTIEFNGTATVFEDANIDLSPLQSGGTKPGFASPGTSGVRLLAYAVGEDVDGTIEIPHAYKLGSDITPHIHWVNIGAPTGTDQVKWELDYWIVDESDVVGGDTTITTGDVAVDTDDERVSANFSTFSHAALGGQIGFKVTRVAAAGDAYAGECGVLTFGFHYEIDTVGSRQITTK